jgi:hypothetical protein
LSLETNQENDMANPGTAGSGDGSRPTTDGGVDNIGAASGFTPGKPGSDAPAPPEKFAERKKDKASMAADGSAPMGLRESARTTPNTEPPRANPGRSNAR